MEALNILEEKLTSLVLIVNRLKGENVQLHSDNGALNSENAKLAQENTYLVEQLTKLEEAVTQEGKELDELNKERKLTKSVVDDLIKSIESLVEKENQL